MNIELRKKNLIGWINGLEDENTVKRLEMFKNIANEWHETLSDNEKKLIDEGMAAVEAGEVHSHFAVMEEAVEYLKKKK